MSIQVVAVSVDDPLTQTGCWHRQLYTGLLMLTPPYK
jgi:hypothetical protein